MRFNGVELMGNPLMTETVRIESRVPGGYLNRWLIREIATVTRPTRQVVHDRVNNVMYMHPVVLAELVKYCASAYPSYPWWAR